jgi:predicted transposase/invertase (TIGR01784 family)
LVEHFSDILYKIKIGGKNSFLYLLFEHKSYIDNWVSFQLLRNMVKIWEGCLKQNKRIKKLPIIVPMVIYHGKSEWQLNSSILPLFDILPKVTEKYVPNFQMEIYDISHMPDEKFKGAVLLQAFLLLQKYIFDPELLEKIPEILGLLNKLSSKSNATEYLEVMLRYLFASLDSSKSEMFKEEVVKAIKSGGTIMPTIAEELLKKGRQEGKLEDAEKMIQKGMTNADIRDITGLSIKEIDGLRKSVKNR